MPKQIILEGYCYVVDPLDSISKINLSFDTDNPSGSNLARLIEDELGYASQEDLYRDRLGKLRITVERLPE